MLVIRKPRDSEVKTLAALEHVCFPKAEAAPSDVMRARYETFPDNFLVAESDGVIRGYINGCSAATPKIEDRMYHDASRQETICWCSVWGCTRMQGSTDLQARCCAATFPWRGSVDRRGWASRARITWFIIIPGSGSRTWDSQTRSMEARPGMTCS